MLVKVLEDSELKEFVVSQGSEFARVGRKGELKAQVLKRRLEVRKKRMVEMKMNENELCDDLPGDEELEEDNYSDEEGYMGDVEEEGESPTTSQLARKFGRYVEHLTIAFLKFPTISTELNSKHW